MIKPTSCTSLNCTNDLDSDYCPECSHGRYEGEGRDSSGKLWKWEFNPYFGPLFLRKDGEPLISQPVGEDHIVWPVFEKWHNELLNKQKG